MKRPREPEEEPAGSDDELSDFSQDRESTPKILELEQQNEDTGVEINCSLPGHGTGQGFKTHQEYEAHYTKVHTNRCVECRKNFPSAFFLELHIEECHDAFTAVKRDKGERTFSCFVEGCDRKCSTPQKRRLHLIDKHMYPRNYFFAITKCGIDGRHSLLTKDKRSYHKQPSSKPTKHPKPPVSGTTRKDSSLPVDETESACAPSLTRDKPQSTDKSENQSTDKSGKGARDAREVEMEDASPSTQDEPKTSTEKPEQESKEVEMEDLSTAMSALRFVPTSVRFGRGGKAGFSKR